jgi:hypothetical protein
MRLFRFLIRRKNRLDPQFLGGHGLRRTDRCNQRKIIQHRLGFAEADWDHWQDRRSADCPAIIVSWFGGFVAFARRQASNRFSRQDKQATLRVIPWSCRQLPVPWLRYALGESGSSLLRPNAQQMGASHPGRLQMQHIA